MTAPRLPWWLHFAGLILYPWWVVRSPRRALTVLAAMVMAAGLVVVAVHGPVQGCAWRGVAVPGERAHWICERTA